MKKIFSFLLCIILIFLCVSCAAADEIVPEYDSGMSEDSIDLKGDTYVMGMVQDYFFEQDSTLSYINNTELGDLAVQRLKDVENQYNCKIRFDIVGRSGEAAFNSAVAGIYQFDFISEESYFLVNYMKANAFIDLTTLENMDVFDESKWGNKYMLVSTMFNGAIYGVLPAAHPMRVSNSIDNMLVVNENYISKLLAPDPRDYFENGEWNWDTFEKCLVDYSHNDSSTNEYIYALATGFGGFSRELAMCNGVEVFTFDDNGGYTFGYFTQPAVDAYNKAFDWFYGTYSSYVNSNGGGIEPFVNGASVMTLLGAYQVVSTTESIAYKMDNFGLVPIPYGPNADGPDDYRTSYSSADFTMCIPLTARDPEVSALVLDKIYAPFKGFETEEDVVAYLAKNYFVDARDAQFFLDVTKDDHVYYHDHYHSFSTMFDHFPGDGIAKGIQGYQKAQLEAAEKYLYPAYKTLEDLKDYFHE